jgi:hypothetical protein
MGCERALYRAIKAVARAEYMAMHIGETALADDITSIQGELLRVQRSIVHAGPRPSASPPHCA